MEQKDWSKAAWREAMQRGADQMGVSFDTYVEFIRAADEVLTLALNVRMLNAMRRMSGL